MHIEDTEGAVIVHLYNYFLSLRSVGAIIDADFVVQGSMLQSSFGPSLCVVEKETLDEDTGTRVYEELARIEPWHILMQESLSGLYDFTVPISLGESLDNSQFRVTIYVQEDFNSIPYSMEDTSAFDTYAATHIPALQVTVDGSSTTLSQKEPETDEPLGEGFDWAPAEVEADAELPLEPADMKPYSVAISVQLAITDDEYDRLRLDGFVLLSASNPDKLSFAASEQTSEPPVWATEVKIMVKWGAYDDEDMGIEDLRWFTCTTESTGQLVELLDDAETPLDVTAYEILRTYDFSVTPDRHVYLAVKYGESPRCVGMNLSPVAALLGEEAEVDEETMLPYTESHFVTLTTFDRSAIEVDCTGVFRIVPNDTIFRERHLLLLDFSVELDEDYRYRLADAKLTEEPSASIVKSEEYADFMDAEEGKLRMRSGANLEEDDGSVFSDVRGVELDEEPVLTMEDLQMHMEALQEEQDALLRAHVDVQRLCVALLQREKQNQQQTVAASATNPDDKHAAAGDKESAALAEGESAVENDAEKKRHFEENLELIYASRTRLQRQRHETEQISIDLQTRLDDMTAKVNDVCATFVAFKREIMSKSLDSRTGKSIASIRIDAIEASLKEEVLQEVRLRNIGLRMALNKLEKARKNREQLAEGLHMIDFEQLKIENQTLNEKIEERNEELSKLKRKKVTMVQVLTHAREKLRFVEKQNEGNCRSDHLTTSTQ